MCAPCIAHLMGHHNVDAFNILALIFTNKADHEMKERIEKNTGGTDVFVIYTLVLFTVCLYAY